MTVEEMWDSLMNAHGVSEETLQVVSAINGYSRQTMLDVLYAVAALRDFDQEDHEDEDEDEEFEACAGRGDHGDPRCGRKLGHTGPCDWAEI